MNRNQTGNMNGFSLLSLICGILGIVTFCCIYSALVFGALAILFGLLSRGRAKHPCGQAKTGIRIGIIALVLTAALNIYSYFSMIQQYGSLQNALDASYSMLEDMTGMDLKEYYDPSR